MILSVKLFDRCGMNGSYLETSMAWKPIPCIQQHWRAAYRLGSELLSDASRLALAKLTFFGSKDQLLLQGRTFFFRGYAVKSC